MSKTVYPMTKPNARAHRAGADPATVIAGDLRLARRALGLSQEAVATRLGLAGRAAMHKLETGAVTLSLGQFLVLVTTLREGFQPAHPYRQFADYAAMRLLAKQGER